MTVQRSPCRTRRAQLGLAIFTTLSLSACDGDRELEAKAMTEFFDYCTQQKVTCTNSMLDNKTIDLRRGFFEFTIAKEPEHFVTVLVYRGGRIEVSIWRDRN